VSLKVKVKGQRLRLPGTKTAFFGPSSGLRAVCLVKYLWPLLLVQFSFTVHTCRMLIIFVYFAAVHTAVQEGSLVLRFFGESRP